MVLGLAQYRLSARHLGQAGLRPGHSEGVRRKDRLLLLALAGALALLVVLTFAGVIRLDPVALAGITTYFIVGIAFVYFVMLFLFFKLDTTEKKRVAVIAILFVSSAMFWSGFEQAGSSLNLFAERYTDRVWFHQLIPAGWFQSLGPVFIISLAPVVAAGWLALARRNWEPSLATKFAWGLILLALGFLVMAGASRLVVGGHKAGPSWLILTYLLHTFGELCLSPVGLSSVTKLAPRRFVGQMMGIWFLATSLGNLIAGRIAGSFSGDALAQMPGRYLQIVLTTLATGLVLLAFYKPIQRLTAGVR
jgi:POT family proton-dependent oligopeptide transporter